MQEFKISARLSELLIYDKEYYVNKYFYKRQKNTICIILQQKTCEDQARLA